jgi:large subunit ribosomal protein L30
VVETKFQGATQTLKAPFVRVTLIRSYAGKSETQRRTFRSLGLRKRGCSAVLPNVNSVLGQINKIIQFVVVEPVQTQGESA